MLLEWAKLLHNETVIAYVICLPGTIQVYYRAFRHTVFPLSPMVLLLHCEADLICVHYVIFIDTCI